MARQTQKEGVLLRVLTLYYLSGETWFCSIVNIPRAYSLLNVVPIDGNMSTCAPTCKIPDKDTGQVVGYSLLLWNLRLNSNF